MPASGFHMRNAVSPIAARGIRKQKGNSHLAEWYASAVPAITAAIDSRTIAQSSQARRRNMGRRAGCGQIRARMKST